MTIPLDVQRVTRVDEVTGDGLRTVTVTTAGSRIEVHLINEEPRHTDTVDMPIESAVVVAADILRWALLYRQGGLWDHLGQDVATSLLDTVSTITDPMWGFLGKYPTIHAEDDCSHEIAVADDD